MIMYKYIAGFRCKTVEYVLVVYNKYNYSRFQVQYRVYVLVVYNKYMCTVIKKSH